MEYKLNINDKWESLAFEIMNITAIKSDKASYQDPHIPAIKTNERREFNSVELAIETLTKAETVVLTTCHSKFDVKFIQEHTKMVVDMRNIVKEADDKVYKLR